LNNTECGWYGRWQGTVSASNEWGRFLFLLFCLDEALRICCLFAGVGSDVVFRLDLPLQMEKQLYWQRLSLRICWISLIPILPGMAAPIAVALQPPNENEARDTWTIDNLRSKKGWHHTKMCLCEFELCIFIWSDRCIYLLSKVMISRQFICSLNRNQVLWFWREIATFRAFNFTM
jgi:hypothetical protein